MFIPEALAYFAGEGISRQKHDDGKRQKEVIARLTHRCMEQTISQLG